MKVNKVNAALNEYHQAHPGEMSEEIISAFIDDKPITRKDKGEDFITFVLKRLDSEYSRNKIGYSRYKNGQSCMNIFQQFLRATNNGTYKPDGLYIGEVTPELIDKYIKWRRDFKNNSDATINHALTPILKGCENACALGLIDREVNAAIQDMRIQKRRRLKLKARRNSTVIILARSNLPNSWSFIRTIPSLAARNLSKCSSSPFMRAVSAL